MADHIEDLTSTDDIEFKKKVYLILKSSLSGDEAAHKILKLRIEDLEKYRVVDIVVKSSVQETTYSKFYGLLLERLCSTHKSWKQAFERVLLENYESLNTFEPAQLRVLGKLWGHLFASDYLGFELFHHFKINEEDSTPPSRIFLKFLFQELVADIGIEEVQERLSEEYIRPYLTSIFPEDDIDAIRYSINYFTSIGLGVLTKQMRERLQSMEETQKLSKKETDLEQITDPASTVTDTNSWKKGGPLPSQENKYANNKPFRSRGEDRYNNNNNYRNNNKRSHNKAADDKRKRLRRQSNMRSRSPPRENQSSDKPSRGNRRSRTPPRGAQRSRTPPNRRNRSRSPKR
ncbi:Pre-mRNA-splicing factor CWC22 [Nakaseomyces bracarensis]|uniref:Pre-mRNA-splicing factor CWC22 n=1 Tax=Nakaseomyces bracarensis TaxID=273131 RepID=A0ABR4NWW8_9SACH